MILKDELIATFIQNEKLGVEPKPEPNQVQPASLDIRLGETVTLEPGDTHQPYTLETFTIPNDIGALMTGRSSVGRDDVIVHKTAGWIDPGFHGRLLFEMKNLGNERREFEKGTRVGQLIFFPLIGLQFYETFWKTLVEEANQPYDGQYQNQGT